jgi:hypothetical protein
MRHFLSIAPAALLLGGCITVHTPSFMLAPADRQWEPTLARARALADNGRIAGADSLLAHYSATYPTSKEAREADYWRALLDLRSAPDNSRIADALPLLQHYVSGGPTTEHWMEADALLRAASRVDTLNRVSATYTSKGDVTIDAAAAANARAADVKADLKAVSADNKSQDEEIKRLRDELAKSKDELDRIKKRLAEPPKKPPY